MITLSHPIDSYSFMAGVMAVLLTLMAVLMARDLAADQILGGLDYILRLFFWLFEAVAWLVYYALYFMLWLPWRVWCWVWAHAGIWFEWWLPRLRDSLSNGYKPGRWD